MRVVLILRVDEVKFKEEDSARAAQTSSSVVQTMLGELLLVPAVVLTAVTVSDFSMNAWRGTEVLRGTNIGLDRDIVALRQHHGGLLHAGRKVGGGENGGLVVTLKRCICRRNVVPLSEMTGI